jgi:hypothetical protein
MMRCIELLEDAVNDHDKYRGAYDEIEVNWNFDDALE